ncbi:hypothetical protein ALC60_09571 [Trachymyrmex zeteki]|uniref:Transmembrane protein n=1 Tax=Mycetomoellerius zeteki TaxID=64791 RepID=A0A151WTQ2_9HYME|nr:hypothetical protein ALC60_09571 [Trachymyrmex zeteki]
MASLKYVIVLSLLTMMLAHCYAHHHHEDDSEQSPSDPTFPPSNDETGNSKTDEPVIEPKIFMHHKMKI